MNPRGRALRSLAACLRAGPDLATDAFPSIAAADWPAILAIANRHLMTAALARAVAPHRGAVPAEVWSYIDYLHTMNRRRNRLIRRQAQELIRALNRAGIEPLLLKGVLMTLFERTASVGTRMMADIDVVVPAQARDAAIEAIERLGYRPGSSYPLGHHAVAEYVRDGDPAAVDLHIELVDQHYILPAAEMWDGAERVDAAGGGTYRVPSPTHRVLHNILHAQIHHRGGFYLGEIDVRQLFELAYLARTYARAIDWSFIAGRLHQHRLDVMLQSYVGNAQQLMGLPWPLDRPCGMRARFHTWRCRMQFNHPALLAAAKPWANLRLAFAWHRMAALYRAHGGTALQWRYRHLRYLLGRHSRSFVLEKLFRV